MDKIERVDAVLNNESVDRPPVSLWYHFGIQHGQGVQFARVTVEFFDYYDFDYLKVMNDYYYPPPNGLNEVLDASDLRRFKRFDVINSGWREQFAALRYIADALNGRAYFVDTVFDPWQSIRRHFAEEQMPHLMEYCADALLEALDVVTDNLINYCRTSLKLGAAGIFMSVPAAEEILTRQQFLTFVKPFAMRVFETIAPEGRMNIAHIHGDALYFEDVIDFPVDVFNWWDRGVKGPRLGDVLDRIDGCVMGGIDHTIVSKRTAAFMARHVREGIQLGGPRRFFLANGCTIDSWVYPGILQAIVQTAQSHRW